MLPALPQEINTLMAAANLPACTINVLDFQQSNKASYHKIEVITPGSTKLPCILAGSVWCLVCTSSLTDRRALLSCRVDLFSYFRVCSDRV